MYRGNKGGVVMKHSNNEQLNKRIESFLARKHQQYPELSLLHNEKESESSQINLKDKFLNLMTSNHSFKVVQ